MNPDELHDRPESRESPEYPERSDASKLIDGHLRYLAPLVLSRLHDVLGQKDQIEISTKSAAYDLVTDADRSIETWLWEETHHAFADDGFLGEEHGWQHGPTGSTDWVVDPIDATMNLVNGLPWACCSVGAMVAGEAEGGLIVDPYRSDTYLTASSLGRSELNGVPVQVAPHGDLAGRIVLLEVPSGAAPRALSSVEAFVHRADGVVRFMGSGALALAMVAAGRALAVVHLGPSIWDVAAGVALVEHSGGVAVGTEGSYVLGQPGPLLAGNATICERLQPLLR